MTFGAYWLKGIEGEPEQTTRSDKTPPRIRTGDTGVPWYSGGNITRRNPGVLRRIKVKFEVRVQSLYAIIGLGPKAVGGKRVGKRVKTGRRAVFKKGGVLRVEKLISKLRREREGSERRAN